MHLPLVESFNRGSSSIDWCEDNYVHSSYIAEFWNTVSSFALLLYPVLMLLISHRYTRFFTSKSYGTWLIHCAIGSSSIYYHATLSLAGQLLDEIAILWVLVYTLALWLPVRYYDNRLNQTAFQLCCAVSGVLITLMGTVYPVLNAFCLIALSVPFGYVVVTEVKAFNLPVTNTLCKRTLFFLVAGVTVWASDRLQCHVWQNLGFPYLHSFWHCCIAVAGHEVCIIAMYFHSLENWNDLHTEVAFWPKGFPRHLTFPYVRMTPKEPNNNILASNGVRNGKSSSTKLS